METADSAAGLGNVMTRWRARHLPGLLLLRLPLSLAVALLSTPPRLVWLSMCRAFSRVLSYARRRWRWRRCCVQLDRPRPQPAVAAGAAAATETQTRTHDTPTTGRQRGAVEADWVFLARCALVACVNFS